MKKETETARPEAERAASREEENRDHRFYRKGFGDGQAKARAEVLAACINATCVLCRTEKPYLMWFGGKNWKGRYQAWVHDVKLESCVEVQTCPANAIRSLQPAASDLEALLEQAHEAALPHAAEQLVKALTEGGEFTVGSPLAKVKQRVEALLREERLEEAKLRPHQDGCAALLTGAEADDCDDWCGRNKRIAKLEKARASEGDH